MTFEAPAFLLLLALLALVPLVARSSREDRPGPRRRLSVAIRSVLLAAIVLALARPALRGLSDRLVVVFAVDDSDSMGPEEREAVKNYLDMARAAMGVDDRAAIVVFGQRALVEAAPAPLLPGPPYASRPGGGASDIAAGLRLASALFEPGAGRRIVLLTDGEETQGALGAAAAAAVGSGIDVRLVALGREDAGDAWVEALDAPDRVARGEPFDLELVVRSRRDRPARLSLYAGQDLIATDEVALEAGAPNVFLLEVEPSEAGLETYRVALDAEADSTPHNDRAEATVEVGGEPLLLLAGPRPERLAALAALLEEQGVRVVLTGVDGIPARLPELRRFQALWLANVSAQELGDELMATIAVFVRDAGGSLLMTGGERSFGLGGYLDTPIEAVLPVSMEVKERRYYPSVALVAAIDKSGSMAGVGPGQKIEIAKAGAAAAIGILDASDEAGVVGFDSAAQWVVPLQELSAREEVLKRLATLRADGGTDIYPAMAEAREALNQSNKRVKHLILLSDGISPDRDYAGLALAMAGERISVSTVAVGTDADQYTMRLIAEAGNGRAYSVSDPALLPRIFTKEALTVQRSYVVEETFVPSLVRGHDVLSGIALAEAPALTGYVATYPKGQGELILASPRGDPILSAWRIGLGKAVAFTADVEGVWSRAWIEWPGWGRLWSQTARWATRGGVEQGIEVSGAWEAGRLSVTADVVGEGGDYVNFAALEAAVVGARGERRALELKQTGPGRYEGALEALEPGARLVSVVLEREGLSGTATVDVPFAPEFRPGEPGLARLERAAAASGAHLGLEPERAFDRDVAFAGTSRPLRGFILWSLPALLLLDVAVRRVSLPAGWQARLARAFSWPARTRAASAPALASLKAAKERSAQPAAPAGAVHEAQPEITTAPVTAPEKSAPVVAAARPQPAAEPPSRREPPAAVEPEGEASTTARLLGSKKRRKET